MVRAYAESGIAAWLAGGEVLLSVVFYLCAANAARSQIAKQRSENGASDEWNDAYLVGIFGNIAMQDATGCALF